MIKRLLQLPLKNKSSLFLQGPRDTGKTSWIRNTIPGAIYLDLFDFETYNLLAANPSRLEKLIPENHTGWIVIDEVQRIPEILNEVHRLIESHRFKFLLTGSSTRSLRRKGTNLLAGRALRYTMHPLVIQELDSIFNLQRAMLFGMLPSVFTHPEPKIYLESYVQTYIKKELAQEALTRNIGDFYRFLKVASFSQGSVLNMAKIARELSMNRLTVANYFDILEDLLLAIRIPVFTQRAKRKMIAHQKFYFFDAGVYRTIRPMGPLDSPDEAGIALETLFFQSLLAVNEYYRLDYRVYFWRTAAGDEVDFVLYGPRGLHAFEIKKSSHLPGKALKGLKTFKEDYPEAKLWMLFLGAQKEYYDGITAIPFEEALKELPKLLS
jgi:predicted AAA+ superfamily ATPase